MPFIQLPLDTTNQGKKIDTVTVAISGQHREVVVLGDPTSDAGLASADATNGLDVDVTRIVPGTAATQLGKAVGGTYATLDVGVALLAVRNDAATPLGADQKYQPLTTNSVGALYVTGGGGGTQYAEAATAATATGTAVAWKDTGNAMRVASAATPLPVNHIPQTTGGYSNYHKESLGSTNAANIKASTGQVFGLDAFNVADYPVYIKLHNTTGTPTAGSGVIRTFGVQAGSPRSITFPDGLAFATGIGITIVKDLADAGTTAVLAADCVVDVAFK